MPAIDLTHSSELQELDDLAQLERLRRMLQK